MDCGLFCYILLTGYYGFLVYEHMKLTFYWIIVGPAIIYTKLDQIYILPFQGLLAAYNHVKKAAVKKIKNTIQ